MTTIPIEELEAHLREVLARVQAGERLLIARDGEPVAELSPCDPLAAIERAFPGMRRATRHMRDIEIRRVRLSDGTDILDVLREVTEDRDLLP
ncbi:MAG: type II toxin-antitoxin system prevent-host-death family antitoxin [Chloroflexi bacterium]|nr:type II toxin-antitoxin system prevent-host-death family antitoxin [Chloroflexota bacterium]